jgi:hypothetical protein
VSATLVLGEDEHFLVDRGNYFDIYDAENGSLIDSTSMFQGTYQYAIKLPGHLTEFVTRQSRTIRIYKPYYNLFDLTIARENDWFRLRWNTIHGAQSYSIYVAYPAYYTEPVYLTTVPDTTYSFPMPAIGHGEFTIHANF